ncbi:DUF4145 domain-containing protein [Spiroplasma endosymbiont of Panorpa germanica]|uniref:DUF4145 domain-containing protein n=1 Tax=Spiroplasma endosymbiont of Panorpa germanica TaxID=3066314 RepID=UPI0030CD48E1
MKKTLQGGGFDYSPTEPGSYYIVWICSRCNRVNLNMNGNIKPISLIPTYESLDILKKLDKCEDSNLIKLFNEFIKCANLKFNSAAAMLGRKILAHLVQSETKFNFDKKMSFQTCVEAIEKSGILGNKWKQKLESLRKIGNAENHQIKIATDEEINLVKSIIEGLIDNIYH